MKHSLTVIALILTLLVACNKPQSEPPIEIPKDEVILNKLNDDWVAQFRKDNPDAKLYSMIGIGNPTVYEFTYTPANKTQHEIISLKYKKVGDSWELESAKPKENTAEQDAAANP